MRNPGSGVSIACRSSGKASFEPLSVETESIGGIFRSRHAADGLDAGSLDRFLITAYPGRRSAAAPLRSALGWFRAALSGRRKEANFLCTSFFRGKSNLRSSAKRNKTNSTQTANPPYCSGISSPQAHPTSGWTQVGRGDSHPYQSLTSFTRILAVSEAPGHFLQEPTV